VRSWGREAWSTLFFDDGGRTLEESLHVLKAAAGGIRTEDGEKQSRTYEGTRADDEAWCGALGGAVAGQSADNIGATIGWGKRGRRGWRMRT